MSVSSLGIDLVEVQRFLPFVSDPSHPFLVKTFTQEELHYCFSSSNPAVHLAGTFALKEASSKALGVESYPFITLEVRREKGGKPEVWHEGKKVLDACSISHTNTHAIAIAGR